LEKKPLKTFLWPWIFLALISLHRVIITKALKTTVKWIDGGARRSEIFFYRESLLPEDIVSFFEEKIKRVIIIISEFSLNG
jgi:hypothetical protein